MNSMYKDLEVISSAPNLAWRHAAGRDDPLFNSCLAINAFGEQLQARWAFLYGLGPQGGCDDPLLDADRRFGSVDDHQPAAARPGKFFRGDQQGATVLHGPLLARSGSRFMPARGSESRLGIISSSGIGRQIELSDESSDGASDGDSAAMSPDGVSLHPTADGDGDSDNGDHFSRSWEASHSSMLEEGEPLSSPLSSPSEEFLSYDADNGMPSPLPRGYPADLDALARGYATTNDFLETGVASLDSTVAVAHAAPARGRRTIRRRLPTTAVSGTSAAGSLSLATPPAVNRTERRQ